MVELREWIQRLLGAFHAGRSDRDLEEELRLHLEMAAEDARQRTGSAELSSRAARIDSGGIAQAMDSLRDRRGLPWLEDLRQDVRYAVRTLRQSPSFSLVAALTLALGIGATTAIYSVVDSILLQPLAFADSDRLVRVFENVPNILDARRPPVQRDINYRNFLEWRARSRTFSDAAAVASLGQRTVRAHDGLAQLWGGMTSANTFRLLGARAMLGRTLTPDDDRNPSVVVLSFDVWRRIFQGDRSVIGTTIELREPEPMMRGGVALNAQLLTVIGVLPASFEFPTERLDFYTPFVLDGASQRSPAVTFIGRLADGVSLDTARNEANAIGTAIRPPRSANAPALTVPRFGVQRLKEQMVRELRPALGVLLAAVAIVLLIVCANVANLLLARGTARQREMAIRYGLGASRGRLARQMLTECVVLSTVGGALGALLGAAGVSLVRHLASVEAPGIFRFAAWATVLPRGNEVGVDLKMLGTAFVIAGLSTVLFGVMPALHLSRANHLQAMGSRGIGPGQRESRIRSTLVVGQLVMATVLLVAAGLLANSFIKLSRVENGYDPSNVLAFQLVFPADYSIVRKTQALETLVVRLGATPGIEAAGFTRAGILIPEEISVGTFVPQGRTLDEMRAEPTKPRLRPVSLGYLAAMGVRLVDGRHLNAADSATAPPVIVVNQTLARRYFGAASAVGQFVDWYVGKTPPSQVQVIGVVEDVRNVSPDQEAVPEIFIDYRQSLALQQRWGDSIQRQDETTIGFTSFAIRTAGDPTAAMPTVNRIVRSVDPNAGVDAMMAMERLVANSIARQRFYAVMLGIFAGVAGVLAAIGIYGVLAYAVIQRTQEIGIRMALGARRAQVLGLVLRRGVILTTVGVGLGLVAAATATRLLQGMLFGVTPLDAKTFLAVSLMFGLVATFACYLPARRATRVDPMVALRNE